MGKINKICERRSLCGCSGCPILHTICDKEKTHNIKKEINYKISLKFAQEEENKFFKENNK